jgi:hypothetical protein
LIDPRFRTAWTQTGRSLPLAGTPAHAPIADLEAGCRNWFGLECHLSFNFLMGLLREERRRAFSCSPALAGWRGHFERVSANFRIRFSIL